MKRVSINYILFSSFFILFYPEILSILFMTRLATTKTSHLKIFMKAIMFNSSPSRVPIPNLTFNLVNKANLNIKLQTN